MASTVHILSNTSRYIHTLMHPQGTQLVCCQGAQQLLVQGHVRHKSKKSKTKKEVEDSDDVSSIFILYDDILYLYSNQSIPFQNALIVILRTRIFFLIIKILDYA